LDGYPSSALPWLPEDPSDILSIFPFLSDRVFEPLAVEIFRGVLLPAIFHTLAYFLTIETFSVNLTSIAEKIAFAASKVRTNICLQG
jgi:hypothetical protein